MDKTETELKKCTKPLRQQQKQTVHYLSFIILFRKTAELFVFYWSHALALYADNYDNAQFLDRNR